MKSTDKPTPRTDHPLDGTSWLYEVQVPGEAVQYFLSLLSPDEVASADGLIPEAVVGRLTRLPDGGKPISREILARSHVFVEFLHAMIARHGPEMAGIQAEARRQVDGWVYIIDARTPDPTGKVPPRDILGGFEVKAGRVVAGSYRRNPNHVILSADGFFRLPPDLHRCVVDELKARKRQEAERASGEPVE